VQRRVVLFCYCIPARERHGSAVSKEQNESTDSDCLLPIGTFGVLAFAEYLEVQGDACFQAGLYHASGMRRVNWFLAGAAAIMCYSLFLNSLRKLTSESSLASMFLSCRSNCGEAAIFHQSPTKPIKLAEPLSSLVD